MTKAEFHARIASTVIEAAFEANAGNDPYLRAAESLDERRLLMSPMLAAEIAANEKARVLGLMRSEITRLEGDRSEAGIRLTLSWMSAVLDRIEAAR